jgi:hypothetical protein
MEMESKSSAFGKRGGRRRREDLFLSLSDGRWFELIVDHIVFVKGEVFQLYTIEN